MPVRVKERKLFQDAKYLLYGPMMCRRSIAILKQLLAGIGWVLSCAFFVWRFKKKMSAACFTIFTRYSVQSYSMLLVEVHVVDSNSSHCSPLMCLLFVFAFLSGRFNRRRLVSYVSHTVHCYYLYSRECFLTEFFNAK